MLNNLLENREMNLEDGRFLTSTSRYDLLMGNEDNARRVLEQQDTTFNDVALVRVHPSFRVIALGLPVPRYEGNTLDPPFRSRFQALDVSSLVPKTPHQALQQLQKVTGWHLLCFFLTVIVLKLFLFIFAYSLSLSSPCYVFLMLDH